MEYELGFIRRKIEQFFFFCKLLRIIYFENEELKDDFFILLIYFEFVCNIYINFYVDSIISIDIYVVMQY